MIDAKTVIRALAAYKVGVDESLLKILEGMGTDKLEAQTKAFFPSVLLQLKHVFGSDVNWIKRLVPVFPRNKALAASSFASYDLEALKARPSGEQSRLFAELRALDRDILGFVDALGTEDLEFVVRYRNYRGEEEAHELWKILLHWFNHGTHHRGTISGQLDELGVQNDYSSLLSRI